MWAALSNPGLEAVAFNPAGLSPAAFATMTPLAMDPVSATSLAGLSVITGRIYAVLAGDGGDRKVRHGLSALGAALGRVAAAGASGDACDFDIGFAAAKRGTE